MAPGGGTFDGLSIAVVGCGYWGSNYVRNFAANPRCRVAAVADERRDRLDEIRRLHPGIRSTQDGSELLDDPEVEAVAIATPASTHVGLCRAALEAGKHVVLAKPMAATVAEAEELDELAVRCGLTLLIDHTYLYSTPLRMIRDLLEAGALGEPYYFDSVRVNLGPVRSDVNVIWDLAAHDISIATYLFGRDPNFVHAIGASYSASGLEDVGYVTLTSSDDLLAHCHVSWLSPVKIRQTLVAGSEKMVVWNDLDLDEPIRVCNRGVTISPDTDDAYKLLVDYRLGDIWTPHVESHEPLAAMVDHFVDCVRAGLPPLTDGKFGVRVVRLLEAAAQSLREGGRPVEFAPLPTV